MKHLIEINGIETEATMTRAEVLALHAEMLKAHGEGMALLETIRNETGLNQAGLKAAREEQLEQAEHAKDEGLTSEINTSRTMVPLADTIRGLVEVLGRHPHGFKGDGTRDCGGRLRKGFKPFTPEEDEAGQKWADGPKQGKEWALTGKLSTDCWTGGE